jgi:hypothetical protein
LETSKMCGDSTHVRTPDTPQKPHIRRLLKTSDFPAESTPNVPQVLCK